MSCGQIRKKENMAEPSIREGTNAEDLNTGMGK